MENILSVKNLNKSFGKRKIINDMSFQVNGGEIFGFLGPNGSGKTTTIKMIMGFLFPDSGEISICGMDLKKNYEKAMNLVGGIVENPEMYKEMTGRQNLQMYARLHDNVSKERIDEVIALVGMSQRADEKIKKYSLGMKQRIGVAQAIVHKPKLLILDEPTNGLDPAGIKELRDILKRLAHEEGIAVMVSSHMLAEMELMCDRVAIINQGSIVDVKPIDELLNMFVVEESYSMEVLPEDIDAAVKIIFPLISSEDSNESVKNDNEPVPVKIKANPENGIINIVVKRELVPMINKKLVEANIDVFGIKKIDNSLEEAFIKIVGGGTIA